MYRRIISSKMYGCFKQNDSILEKFIQVHLGSAAMWQIIMKLGSAPDDKGECGEWVVISRSKNRNKPAENLGTQKFMIHVEKPPSKWKMVKAHWS